MQTLMPCGLDDPRIRLEPGTIDVSVMTEMEMRISWICDEWADALKDDTYDTWRDVRMMVFGAVQALIHCDKRHDDRAALSELGNIAFENGLVCLRANKYEGFAA